VSYALDPAAVTVNLETGIAVDGYTSLLTLVPAESLISVGAVLGSGYGDSLTGSDFVNQLFGGVGDDTLAGYGKHGLLEGGDGTDSLNGGGGIDTCMTGEVLANCES